MDVVDDAELIRVLTKKKERGEASEFIRAALYAYLEQPSRKDVMGRMRELERRMEDLTHLLRQGVEAGEGGGDSSAEKNLRSRVEQWRKA
jgi:Arc/MetJ-type ribon-helix-helix transcriptional regulator